MAGQAAAAIVGVKRHPKCAREALVNLCTLPLLAGDNISGLSGFGRRDPHPWLFTQI
ncbi:MAG: hypothetical protein QOF35_2140 [Actinomycetota bacterium]|nr:hypothetical protein [Actinomycetota bacterium]